MEKLLRRTLLSRNQLVHKDRRELAKDLRKAWREYNRMKNRQDTEVAHLAKAERTARREDWMLGPLAPKRSVGKQKELYGALDGLMAQGPTLPKRERCGPSGRGYDAVGSEDKRIPGFEKGEWSGVGLVGNLAVGDRVVVGEGRVGVKGKIGEVVRIDEEANTVIVKGVNKADLIVPPQSRFAAGGLKIYEQELPIPISDLRLVTQLEDPETGAVKDVIVDTVYGGYPWKQKNEGSNLPRHTRYIRNYANPDGTVSDIEIAWPKEDKDRFYTQAVDTPRDNVEERTYFPALIQAVPLEEGVIDELRAKHSRLRRDWDDLSMMRQKLMEDARRDWFHDRSKVLSSPFWSRNALAREKKAFDEKERMLNEKEKKERAERREKEIQERLAKEEDEFVGNMLFGRR